MTRSRPRPWRGGTGDATPRVGEPPGRTVVVGVAPGQPAWVVQRAGDVAGAMGAGLLCVWADAGRARVAEEPDGTLVTTPLDPDHLDDSDVVDDEERLAADLERALEGRGVRWRLVYTVGEVGRALEHAAEEHDASLIALGRRRPGIGGWVNQALGGSLAAHLLHSQHRPVLIIPPPGPARATEDG